MLRWVTPIKNMARTVTRDVEFKASSCTPARSSCCSSTRPTATRTCSPTLSSFDIERSPNDHVAFGFGTHFCLGASLARLEVKVMVDRLLSRLPDLELAGDTPLRPANFISGYETMPVTFSPSRPTGAAVG